MRFIGHTANERTIRERTRKGTAASVYLRPPCLYTLAVLEIPGSILGTCDHYLMKRYIRTFVGERLIVLFKRRCGISFDRTIFSISKYFHRVYAC